MIKIRFLSLSLVMIAATVVIASCSSTGMESSSSSTPTPAPTMKTESTLNVKDIKVVRRDPRVDKLVPSEPKFEKLADGYTWVEGPVWNQKGNFLLFSEIPKNAIHKWNEGVGVTLFLSPSGYTGKEPFGGKEPGTNGLTFDSAGLLVACEHGDHRVSRLEADGKTKTTLVDKYNGKRLNSPNDLVFKSNGDLYFTDPPYGLPNQSLDDPHAELDFCGVYRLDKNKKLTLLTKEITRPNGIAFSPDEKKLYVASSDPEKAIWMVYDVKADGTITNGKVFFDATVSAKEGKPGLPDGMKVDVDGNIFATGPGGVYIFAPDGTHLGTLDTGGKTSNCAWGDDGSTLYITADHAVIRVKLTTKGKLV
jgi:gluconolactonase